MFRGKKKNDLEIGLFFLVVSCAYLLGTFSINSFTPFGERGLNSRSIPQVLALFMMLLSVMQLVGTIFSGQKKVKENKDSPADSKQKLPLFLSLVFLVLYIFLFNTLGFIISSVLYLFAMIRLLTPAEKRKRSLFFTFIFSVLVPVLIYILFSKCLALILPKGIFYL